MAKFGLSTSMTVCGRFTEAFIQAGFTEHETSIESVVSITVHKKKRHPVENFLKLDNGDFISLVGTAIFDGCSKNLVLERLIHDFSPDHLEESRDALFGNYAAVIRKGGATYLFTDRFAVIPIFYTSDSQGFAASNSPWHLARAVGATTVNAVGLLEEALLVAPVGTCTPWNEISRLRGDEFIVVQDGQATVQVENFGADPDFTYVKDLTFDAILEEYTEIVREETSKVVSAFGGHNSIGIHQTGGLDNRTIFASFMSLGVKPRTFYGVGNSSLTNTRGEDYEIVQTYADHFALDLQVMDWSTDWPLDLHNWNTQLKRYGLLQSIYSGSQAFFDEYEHKIADLPNFLECGYFGEVLRQREWAYRRVDSKESYTLSEFLNDYLFGPGYGGLFHDDLTLLCFEVRQHVIKAYTEEIERFGQNLLLFNGEVTQDLWNAIEWIHMRNANALMCQFLNDFTNSIALFSTSRLHLYALQIPSSFLQNGKFQCALIERLFPPAFEIPVLSHGEKYIVSPGQGRFGLIPIPRRGGGMLEFLRTAVKRIPILRRTAIKLLGVLDKSRASKKMEKMIGDDFNRILKDNVVFQARTKEFSGSLVYLGILASYLNAVQSVNDK